MLSAWPVRVGESGFSCDETVTKLVNRGSYLPNRTSTVPRSVILENTPPIFTPRPFVRLRTWAVNYVASSQRPSRLRQWKSAAFAMYPPGSKGCRWHRGKFLLRGLVNWRDTEAWLERLSQSDLRPLWQLRPRLALKLQRGYLQKGWSARHCRQALVQHYEILSECVSALDCRQIFNGGLGLLKLSGKSFPPPGARNFLPAGLEINLTYQDQFEKEGELTLAVVDSASGLALANLTFCLSRENGRRVIWIGGIQAKGDPRTRELIHDAAKYCHGLRPKALAVWCLRELAQCWQVARIYAINDAGQVCRGRGRRSGFIASYDEFWAECGSFHQPDGSWELPLNVPRRSRAELRPCHRKEHERRYEMFDILQPQLQAVLAALAPNVAKKARSAA